jgi:1-acyl-sn-glycerol-3-phosphate acyltransferase
LKILRSLLLYSSTAFTTTLSFFIILVAGLINPYSRFCNGVFFSWSWLLCKIAGLKFNVHGLENFDPNKGYVLCPNHRHLFDIPILCVTSKLNIKFAAKKQLFSIPIFGQTLSLIGMVKIDRENTKNAVAELKRAEELISKGVTLVIFPEGTRNKTPEKGMLPFKKGAFQMAINTHQSILPVTIIGSNGVLKGFSATPRTIDIYFHKPIEAKPYINSREALVQLTRAQIESKLNNSL